MKEYGIGPKLVKKLQIFLPSENIDYMTSLLGGMDTIEIMKGYDEVVIIYGVIAGKVWRNIQYSCRYGAGKCLLSIVYLSAECRVPSAECRVMSDE